MHHSGLISQKYLNIISEAEQSTNSAYIKNLYTFRERQGLSNNRIELIEMAQSAIDGAVAPASEPSISVEGSNNATPAQGKELRDFYSKSEISNLRIPVKKSYK